MGRVVPLMIVTDNHEKYINSDNALLSKVLKDVVGVEKEDIIFSDCMQDYSTVENLTKKYRDEFLIKLYTDVQKYNPKCILALGERGMYLSAGVKNLSKKRGVIQTIDLFGTQVHIVPTYSEKDIEANDRYLSIWAKDILKAYNIAKDISSSISPTKMVYCDTLEKVKLAVKYVKQTKLAVFDFETPEIDPDLGTFKEGHHATMVSFSFQAGSGYVIPLEHKDSPFDKETILRIMAFLDKHIFSNPNIRKIAHNLNYDAHICRIYGIKLRGRIDDTMLMHHLYDETKRHGLKGIVEEMYPEYAGYDDDLKGFKWSDIPIKILAQYNATDTDLTYRVAVALESWLLEDSRVYRIYRNLTMAAFKPLFEAECRGMDIDAQFLSEAIREVKLLLQRQKKRLKDNKVVKRYEDYKARLALNSMLDELEEKREKRRQQSIELSEKNGTAYKVTKTEQGYDEKIRQLKTGEISAYAGINFGSWQQLEDLLYDSPEGFQFSALVRGTGKDVIKELPDRTGFVDGLLSYRSLGKTLGTYLEGIHKRLDKNNRVHTSFKLHGTASGRLSSANPNLQNMPNTAKLRDETLIHAVGLVKKSFCVPKDYTLFQFDYSQAELRIIASFAKEKNMLEVYQNDGDIHAKTGSEMIEVDLDTFYTLDPKEQKAARSNAKAVNFGLIYGMSAEGFQEYAKNSYGLILTLEEAKKTRDVFFSTYPNLLEYHSLYKEKARKFGHVRTLYGRKRRTPDINTDDDFKASMDERVAINSPVQGTAGEFTVFAIALLHIRLDKRVIFVNTIHDSILFYVPDDMKEYAIETIKDTMENLPNKKYFGRDLPNVGMKVDAEASKESWKDLQEI